MSTPKESPDAISRFHLAAFNDLSARKALWRLLTATKPKPVRANIETAWNVWTETSIAVRDTAPAVLALFRECGQDATVVFRWLRGVHPAPFDWPQDYELSAALDNLELHLGTPVKSIMDDIRASLTGEHETTRIAAEYVISHPGAKGDEIDSAIKRGSGHFRNHIMPKLKSRGFTGSKKAGYQAPSQKK